jgi:hypothetical protein
MGAMATIVILWLVDRLGKQSDWRAMAWWIHDHLPYSELQFFPKLGAFNRMARASQAKDNQDRPASGPPDEIRAPQP